MDSISYFTQKHCKSGLNKLIAALLLMMAFVALGGIPGIPGLICAAFFAVMAVLTFVYTRGAPSGCTLLQIPLGVLSFMSFFAAIAMSAFGFVIVRYAGMYEYIDDLLSRVGYVMIVPAQTAGTLLCIGALTVFLLSFYTFCAVKYLSTIKSCLNNEISRHGARIFSTASIILFVITAAVTVVFVFSEGGLPPMLADGLTASALTELVIADILLLLSGIAVDSFIKATYAFKVFEDKMMKVETNADGTVYVPIKEDSDRNSRSAAVPVPQSAAKPKEPSGKVKKSFIKDIASLDENDIIDGTHNEYDII